MNLESKAAHFKSRSGCARCKKRKIKCDERKPACERCETRGLQCPGYSLNVRWSKKHELRAERLSAQITTTQQGRASTVELERPDENVQQALDWLNSPSQWDYMIPLVPVGTGSTPAALPIDDELQSGGPGWEGLDLNGMAWTETEDSVSSPFSAVGQSSTLQDLLNRDSAVRHQMVSVQVRSHQQDLPREILNIPTALSQYFFSEVIPLYCAWDSKSNIMRSIAENTWQSSGALYHTIQSMAAACLSESFPHLLPVAGQEHARALELIKTKVTSPTQKQAMVLAATFLGHTSSWLSPHNLDMSMFKASCDMLQEMAAETGDNTAASVSFFNDTLDYWAMLLAYLTDNHQLSDRHQRSRPAPTAQAKLVEPHPYCGISHEVIKVLRDTGILIFGYRKHMSKVKFMTEQDLDVFRAALREARQLERIFLSFRLPDMSQIKEPEDPQTPLKHHELMYEAYRHTGLLQLYRVFPDLLNERYTPWDKDSILRPLPDGKTPTAEERSRWLTELAIYIVSILREISFESGTRSAQPFIMVAVSGELRRTNEHLEVRVPASTKISIDQTSTKVVQARKFLASRLAAYIHILPIKKTGVIFELINHVWEALDSGEQDVYWLDVAYEKKLGTLFG
ncbi:c6 zinc finger protein [Fusarium austroafricanum]|uniref:C6 zinc finger protein n=1 Tax=Fusarium austroafricanum TaxID=2364996 RepID=A0A8H4KVR4_9HYPO|nr:c6 zinc finger protein [Fusarium austroafricanum]